MEQINVLDCYKITCVVADHIPVCVLEIAERN